MRLRDRLFRREDIAAGARPMDPAWVRSLRNQCLCARVPFFFKQWGGTTSKAGGCELDGRTWQQMPGASR